MAASLAELQAQLDALRAARAGAEKRIRRKGPHTEEEVEFKSDAELAAAIFDLERQISLTQGVKVNTVHIFSSKGL
jgi:hypothetical protein